MKIHFFSGTDLPGRSAFRSYYVLHNLKTVRAISLIYFFFAVLIRIIFFVYHSSIQAVKHIDEYDTANWIALLATPLFYFASVKLMARFKSNSNIHVIARVLVILFSLFIIISAMRATFFSMQNPRNTLVMYMLGLIIVSVFYTFEFYETIFVTILTGIFFISVLPFYQHTFGELILNNLASLVLLTAFFCISRYLFSYRADNFLKLRDIEEKNIEIENTSQAKNEILGVVAHDLRNPLATIKSITMLMEMEENLHDGHHDYLQMIKTSCDKASSIINDLIETAQNELRSEFELEKIELDQFLSAIVEEWMRNKKGQINILYHSTANPVYAYIHKEKMHRVMDNLISNALKFSGENHHIEILLTHLDNEIFIDVKDFGIGIHPDLLPFIFDRFSKARRNGVRGEESVGLGLSIVQQIIRKHGGNIEVNSNVERGTTFSIKLPKKRIDTP